MGDIIEFTTSHKPQNSFYRLTSNAVQFEVKGMTEGTICLAREPDINTNVCWILFNNNAIIFKLNQKLIRGIGGEGFNNDLLSMNEFRKFWITWINGEIKVGQNRDTTPLASLKQNVSDIKFITFLVINHGQGESLHWKCHLPPLCMSIKQPTLKTVKGGEMKWVKMHKEMPKDSVIGGYENEILYVCRAVHETALTPGKYVSSIGMAHVSWGGYVHEKDDFEILCGIDCTWVTASHDNIPLGAIEAGYVEVTHEIMYIGRVMCDGHLIPGKVAPSYKVCFFPYLGEERYNSTFEILVDPSYKNRAANNFYITM